MHTRHAETRAKQRSIPPLINEWLNRFGEETYDGNGAVIVFFSRKSVRTMEREFGRRLVGQVSQYLDAYKVESSDDGRIITVGHRIKRVNRK